MTSLFPGGRVSLWLGLLSEQTCAFLGPLCVLGAALGPQTIGRVRVSSHMACATTGQTLLGTPCLPPGPLFPLNKGRWLVPSAHAAPFLHMAP